jgi:hypothetical protein
MNKTTYLSAAQIERIDVSVIKRLPREDGANTRFVENGNLTFAYIPEAHVKAAIFRAARHPSGYPVERSINGAEIKGDLIYVRQGSPVYVALEQGEYSEQTLTVYGECGEAMTVKSSRFVGRDLRDELLAGFMKSLIDREERINAKTFASYNKKQNETPVLAGGNA